MNTLPDEPDLLESEGQARNFGIVAALIDGGLLTWPDFRATSMARDPASDGGPSDVDADLAVMAPALRSVLTIKGLVPTDADDREGP